VHDLSDTLIMFNTDLEFRRNWTGHTLLVNVIKYLLPYSITI